MKESDDDNNTADSSVKDASDDDVKDSASNQTNDAALDDNLLPVLFVHGPSGSASQFESQAQRFMANGYPLKCLDTLEYDSSVIIAAMSDPTALPEAINDPDFQARLGAKMDQLLADCGAVKVNLICLSVTSSKCNVFMKTGDNAQKVAHYVQTDSIIDTASGTPFGGVDTLALWSVFFAGASVDAENVTNDHDDAQGHIEVATSAVSFAKMYEFFNDEAPNTTDIPEAEGDTVLIAGKANIFPYNIGADATSLSIYEVDQSTGLRVEDTEPIVEDLGIDTNGDWGPYEIKKGVAYEFAMMNEIVPTDEQHFYREPFYADDYFIRLNVGRPGEGVSSHLNRDGAHTNLMVARDKEMWSDQDNGNDQVFINDNEVNILTPEAAAKNRMLSSLFLSDQDGEEDSDYTIINDVTQMVFISGVDYYIPSATQSDLSDLSTISIKLISRDGDGMSQIMNVPNWPANQVRTVSAQFRDFVQ
ncbi:MAG: hypothetical protein JXA30_18190 [Deltaproteobacteria bacterium]|nr:hypothetical protein [Deltaproteobacteria bacterium]